MNVCCASNSHAKDTSRIWKNWAHPKSPIYLSMEESRDGWCFSRGGCVLSDSAELGWERSGVELAIWNYVYAKVECECEVRE